MSAPICFFNLILDLDLEILITFFAKSNVDITSLGLPILKYSNLNLYLFAIKS